MYGFSDLMKVSLVLLSNPIVNHELELELEK